MWISVLVVVVLAVVIGSIFLRRMGAKYYPLFDDDHLFRELPERLATLKSAALKLRAEPFSPGGLFDSEVPSDPRCCSTSAGLLVLYTAQDLEAGLYNHLSLSYDGGPMAFAFAARCAFLLLTFLGVDPKSAAVAERHGITHVAFLIRPEEAAQFAQAPSAVAPPSQFRTLRARAETWMDDLRKDGLLLRHEAELLPALLGAT